MQNILAEVEYSSLKWYTCGWEMVQNTKLVPPIAHPSSSPSLSSSSSTVWSSLSLSSCSLEFVYLWVIDGAEYQARPTKEQIRPRSVVKCKGNAFQSRHWMKIPALNRISINVCNIAALQVVTIFVKRSNLRWNHMCATFVTGFLFLLLSRHYSFDKLDIWSKMWSNDYFSSSVGEHLQYTSKKLIKANHVPQIKLWIGLDVVFLPRIICIRGCL